jgi:hypothetical protein
VSSRRLCILVLALPGCHPHRCAAKLGAYKLGTVSLASSDCDAPTVQAMKDEIETNLDLWGVVCVFSTTECDKYGAFASDATFNPRLTYDVDDGGVRNAVFHMDGGSCTAAFDATFVFDPSGAGCGSATVDAGPFGPFDAAGP